MPPLNLRGRLDRMEAEIARKADVGQLKVNFDHQAPDTPFKCTNAAHGQACWTTEDGRHFIRVSFGEPWHP